LGEALERAARILAETIKKLKDEGKYDKIEEGVKRCLERYEEFIKKYPLRERPEMIDGLKPEDLYNPGARNYFFYYVEHYLRCWAALPAVGDMPWKSAVDNIDVFKSLLKKVVDPNVRVSAKVDADEAKKIPWWGGDRIIVKKLVSLYDPDRAVPMLSTNYIEKVVEALKIGELLEEESKKMFGKSYEGLSVGERYEVFSKVMIDVKDAVPELKDKSNVLLMMVIDQGLLEKEKGEKVKKVEVKPLSLPPLLFEPRYEAEALVLFAKYHDKLGFPYVLRLSPSEYPDAILIDEDRNVVRAEFEVRASDFRVHKHDPSKVDYVICWEDDLKEDDELRDKVKIIELKSALMEK